MRQTTIVCVLVCGVLSGLGWPHPTAAERVSWDVVAAGGVVASSGSGHRISASIGQVGVDMLAGPAHRLYSGFWTPWLLSPVGVQSQYGFGLPTTYQLSQNYPNPFYSQTTVPFALPEQSEVSVGVFNLQGQLVRQVAQEARAPGYYVVNWDGRDDSGRRAGSGVYVCRLIARPSGGQTIVLNRSMVLVQ